ncbi:MAG TPA: 4Fe-4S dicluster domain-containing protein [Bryobacteraceae bacterium]
MGTPFGMELTGDASGTKGIPVGALRRMGVPTLGQLINALRQRGYQVIGPVLRDGAISYGPIGNLADLPAGWTSEENPASYRLKRRSDDALFGYATGPKSMKDFLHVSEIHTFTVDRTDGPFRILPNSEAPPRYAFLGVRGCDIAAMFVQDRVLLGGMPADPFYENRRRNCLIIAVHCTEPANTCFCTSMGTGPRARDFDLALTEFVDSDSHHFLVEVGSEAGAELLEQLPVEMASAEMAGRSQTLTERARRAMTRQLDKDRAARLLQENFDSPQWDRVAEKCLACGNCTMVCPTCFCVTFEDSSDITGTHVERWRKWDSCFSLAFSYIHGGSVRSSTKSRYRQWLTHKLSSWVDQFGSSGCVGCGRCITWCPVGIDLTEEVKAIQATSPAE